MTYGGTVRGAAVSYACAWWSGAAFARSSADAVTAAGPMTTLTTAHATVHGLRRTSAQRSVAFEVLVVFLVFVFLVFVFLVFVRLLLMFPTSSRLYADKARERGSQGPLS